VLAYVFLAGFAAFWWGGGFLFAHKPLPLALAGVAVSAGVLLAAYLRRKPALPVEPAERKRRGRILGGAATLEGVAIAVVYNLLIANGLMDYLFPAMALIVGLHFLPMAKLLPMPIYYLSAALLILVAGAGLLVDPGLRPVAVGATSAASLWLTCLLLMFRRSPQPAAA
jgi:hypothetical protein